MHRHIRLRSELLIESRKIWWGDIMQQAAGNTQWAMTIDIILVGARSGTDLEVCVYSETEVGGKNCLLIVLLFAKQLFHFNKSMKPRRGRAFSHCALILIIMYTKHWYNSSLTYYMKDTKVSLHKYVYIYIYVCMSLYDYMYTHFDLCLQIYTYSIYGIYSIYRNSIACAIICI